LSTGAEHVDGRRFRQIHDRLLEAVPSALVIVLLFLLTLSLFLGENDRRMIVLMILLDRRCSAMKKCS
jgi:hypothetical protein